MDLAVSANTRKTLSGVPEGVDALVALSLLKDGQGTLLHIARDDARARSFTQVVNAFAPAIETIEFPAWDCLPYDRVSPKTDISAQRMDALSRLAEAPDSKAGRIVVATLNAVLQRVPPRSHIEQASLRINVGETVDMDGLLAFFGRNGFTRTGTVMEPGEFAHRGGIIDIFPPGAETPLRLDFFGDQLESIRLFDALSQRTIGNGGHLHLVPVSEVPMDEPSIVRFRSGYREQFGNITDADPLYTSISEGRKHGGMEHWLPLFYDKLETLFDYLPAAIITHDHLLDEAMSDRQDQVNDHYASRKSMESTSFADTPPYRPLSPDMLYLDPDHWHELHQGRGGGDFTPFSHPESDSVIDCHGRQAKDFTAESKTKSISVFELFGATLNDVAKQKKAIFIAAYSAGSLDRLSSLLVDHGINKLKTVEDIPAARADHGATAHLCILPIDHGFEFEDIVVYSEQDILGDRLVRSRRKGRRAEDFLKEVNDLNPQDFVVHLEHGIGRYEGLITIDVSGAPHDCLHLSYQGGDKLYVPVENIEVLSRYGGDDMSVQLDKLGGAGWQARKAKLKKRLRDMADELIAIAATRELKKAPKVEKPEGMYDEFCSRFGFQETEDQLRAIEDVFNDLGIGRPMDRLVCGDVGFGKTEIALRSAFAAVMSGGQVAIIAPTTLLARQHFQTFSERFAGMPVVIRQLSRLVTTKVASSTKEEMQNGHADIVIGTHALLAKSVKFKNLLLMVVDEEQHFGVKHKERLKQLRTDVHVLTLTATPIPRTLQLALTGVKELSLIATPPIDRLAVRTFIMPFDPVTAREAILREHYRGGQSFYVCPRIMDLPEIEEFLREYVPEVKFVTAHGQMPPTQLEAVMSAFYEGAYDVLLSTTIIESGLDIPTANTLLVHRADRFGLSQLYQLRGRIGRSKARAYAYFTLPPRKPLTAAAEKRLKVLQSLDTLGAGFTLASHDLDIRGAGNLLGEEQSGHIREVGLELYQQMLEEAVALAKTGGDEAFADLEEWSPQITVGTSVLIPERYVNDLNVRLGLYRRISQLEDQREIDSFAAEMIDRFGPLPDEVEHLLKILAIKRLCRDANIAKIDAGPRGASLSFRNNDFNNPAGLIGFINDQHGMAKLRPDHTFVYRRSWEDPEDRLQGALWLAKQISALAKAAEAHSAA